MSLEILAPGTPSQLVRGSLIGDHGAVLLRFMCPSLKPLSIICRSSTAK